METYEGHVVVEDDIGLNELLSEVLGTAAVLLELVEIDAAVLEQVDGVLMGLVGGQVEAEVELPREGAVLGHFAFVIRQGQS